MKCFPLESMYNTAQEENQLFGEHACHKTPGLEFLPLRVFVISFKNQISIVVSSRNKDVYPRG